MKNKGILSLIEMLIMLLIFALAAVLCLRAFALSDRMSRETAALDIAVTEAQNTAELIKYFSGDLEASAAKYGGAVNGNVWMITYSDKWEKADAHDTEYILTAVTVGSDIGGRADITVAYADGEEIFSLPVSWIAEGAET